VDYSQIRYEKHGEITIIAFNRPEVMNCIGPVTHRELIDAWGRFKEDPDANVAIITGTGERAFCTGGDLKDGQEIVSTDPVEVAAHCRGDRPGYLGPSRWTDIYKPIIAAVNGAAYAGGLEWACFADIRIAEEHATFGVTCRRWNIGLADGGTQRLPRIVGLGRAMELIITGRVIDADEALRIGLANEIVPKGKSLYAPWNWQSLSAPCPILPCAPTRKRPSGGSACSLTRVSGSRPNALTSPSSTLPHLRG
jgi:enoyl-CoA hydratase